MLEAHKLGNNQEKFLHLFYVHEHFKPSSRADHRRPKLTVGE